MKNTPQITVLMPVYNGSRYLKEAIQSILDQSFSQFELLIINDGSTDNSREIIDQFNDPRIRVEHHAQNQGLINTLNEGLMMSRGKYIARMDADDISLPQRLKVQSEFMKSHPAIGICGSYVENFGAINNINNNMPLDHDSICCQLLFKNVLFHPAIMIKKELIEKYHLSFEQQYPGAEDFAFWVKASQVTQLANVPEVLMKYRHHTQQVSATGRQQQMHTTSRIRAEQLKQLLPDISIEELALHDQLAEHAYQGDVGFISDAERWLLKLLAANTIKRIYQQEALRKIIFQKWYFTCANAGLGFKAYKLFKASPLYVPLFLSSYMQFKLMLKCLLRWK